MLFFSFSLRGVSEDFWKRHRGKHKEGDVRLSGGRLPGHRSVCAEKHSLFPTECTEYSSMLMQTHWLVSHFCFSLPATLCFLRQQNMFYEVVQKTQLQLKWGHIVHYLIDLVYSRSHQTFPPGGQKLKANSAYQLLLYCLQIQNGSRIPSSLYWLTSFAKSHSDRHIQMTKLMNN